MSTLFYLNPNPELKRKVPLNDILSLAGDNMPPLPRPIEYRAVNVIKEFKWTKTIRNQDFDLDNVPALYLREYYVTQPGFLSNVQNIGQTLVDTVANVANTETVKTFLQNFEMENSTEAIGAVAGGLGSVYTNFAKKLNILSEGIPVGDKSYMQAYDDLYGVLYSDWDYILPYFNDEFKSIETKWSLDSNTGKQGGGGLVGAITGLGNKSFNIGSIVGMLTQGFGFDFAKTFNYPDEGPSVTFTFYLDNTYDSAFDSNTNGVTPYQKNWELIFLFLYQNLPHKRNRLFFDPPVIYKAAVPGVFSYLYSFMSKLQVTCLGNKQRKNINLVTTGQNNQYTPDVYTTLIPEAYKVDITLTSLLPETKNLMLHGIEDNISVQIQ